MQEERQRDCRRQPRSNAIQIPEQSRACLQCCWGLALCIGVVTSIVAAGLPAFLPMLFTPDRRLWPLMRTVAPQVSSLAVPGHGLVSAGVPLPGICLVFMKRNGLLHDSWQTAHTCTVWGNALIRTASVTVSRYIVFGKNLIIGCTVNDGDMPWALNTESERELMPNLAAGHDRPVGLFVGGCSCWDPDSTEAVHIPGGSNAAVA